MIFQILALLMAVALPIVAVGLLLGSPKKMARDRSARSVELPTVVCLLLVFIGVAALVYWAKHP